MSGNNVAHLGAADAQDRKKIRSHITVGPESSKQVSQDPTLYSEQPAVVAPELAPDEGAPIPQIDQDAQTGPEIVGAEDPRNDTVQKKPTFLERLKKKILK
ncbi:hypothetical protein MBRA1_001038 [Malassezia brasiliensis]|uniref:Uncharacterized protein n=1 Tax=Malassezia brasiliensis TaxID=1821822 RepID=A0AAF0DR19_9BASI|nr:hypothetical protein MBRA1_001038 [Malassezia brasiliensis]